jgi:hypothetical protein
MSQFSHLSWTPVLTGFQEIANQQKLAMVIAPFIQRGAMEYLLEEVSWVKNATVVTRWRASDVTSGVSDINIYPLLKHHGVQLFLNDALHNDTAKLAELFAASRLVTDEMFERVQRYVEENPPVTRALPPLDLGEAPPIAFNGLGLPLLHGAEALWQFYFGFKLDDAENYSFQNGLHDIEVLRIPLGLSRESFDTHVRARLFANPIVSAVTAELERDQSLRFGQVVSRMHRTARAALAVATGPHELTPYARALYEWLPWLNKEIYWDRPKYSMILRLHAGYSSRKVNAI